MQFSQDQLKKLRLEKTPIAIMATVTLQNGKYRPSVHVVAVGSETTPILDMDRMKSDAATTTPIEAMACIQISIAELVGVCLGVGKRLEDVVG